MPHKKDHKIRVEDVFQQTPIPTQRRSPTDEEFNEYLNNLYRRGFERRTKGLLDETSDEEVFRKNEEFYKKHPTDTLKLTPTEHTTQYGRKVYKDQFGAIHSESTATVPSPKGGWMNIPLIYNGKYVTEDRARDIIINNGMVDPETGEKVRSYRDIPEAEEAARNRMRTLNKPDQPWNDWFVNPAKGQQLAYRGSTYDPAGDSPINYEALGIIPQEPASLFNFVTDIKYDPDSYRIPVNPRYQHYPADISGVKFGTVLPDRNKVEGLILQAAEFAGLQAMYTEGIRTPAQNKLVGGKEHSKHLIGQAFDLSIRGGDTPANRVYFKKLEELLHPLGFGLEFLHGKNHIHVQYPRKGK